MILTLKELADKLRVNERTILRMLKSGQISGVKIGGQWRFNGSEIDHLFFPSAQSSSVVATAAVVDAGDVVSLSELIRRDIRIPVSRVLKESRVIPELDGVKREDILEQMSGVLKREGLVMDVSDLRHRLLEREKLLSTGIGHGIAIPHPRDPIVGLNAPAVIVMARHKAGVKYNAIDGLPVKLFFLLCCENIEMHLHMMGQLARLLQDERLLDNLLVAADASSMYKAVLESEQKSILH